MTRDEAKEDYMKRKLSTLDTEAIKVIDRIYDDFEKECDELNYKFSCVLDNATGGCISKPNTDKAIIDEAMDRQNIRLKEEAVRDYKEEK